ncbi:AraC family transcriptional regulator [Herpetosiphon sp.]|uniref:Transcriptional regulator, AraC family n=1 Tax=Herpetosiphon aurantiacus (strain ATCC 23779 / DSM 785 / 114-95) TaxID=316274 RepID=A9AU92_HERA2|nr:AraC family transcriptional regulator [Herpetosiphon sp.]ABX03011.1 transcriptional regulator, AraC family [Herpetosiphon aurantiacus DSM 785]
MPMTQEHQTAWERQHRAANYAEISTRIAHILPSDGMIEPLPGVHVYRVSGPTEPIHGVTVPAFCVIVQGRKMVLLAADQYHYDPAHYLLTTAALPVVGQITEATPEAPYLSLRFALSPALISSVMAEVGVTPVASQASVRALAVSSLDGEFMDVVVRLVRLFNSSRDAQVLGPLIMRELVYRLLMSEQGMRLRQIAIIGGAEHRIMGALAQIQRDFHQPLRIPDLAQAVGMSVSGFHSHFKAVTAMSPGQYQQQLRLQEARRLLLSEDLDAASVGARVGYDDAAYFTRAYKRLFGAPPIRDATRMRAVVMAGG